MCCLFGLIDYRGSLSGRQKSRILSVLSAECEARGIDATGFSYFSGNRMHIIKRPVPAHQLKIRIPQTVCTVMGHTRMTTQGNALKNKNNHPFPGCAGGTDFALAHNGVLYNDKMLRKHLNLPRTNIETDSYIAVQILEKIGSLSFDSLRYMAEQVNGTFNFTILDQENTLYFVKGNNPLCIYHYPKLGCYLYASTQEILSRAVKKLFLKQHRYDLVPLACGEILRIDASGYETISHFQADHLFADSYWYRGFHTGTAVSYAPLTAPYIQDYSDDEYLQELKAFASFQGIDLKTIDHLLQDGFTTEELEDFLYCGEL